MTRKKIRPVLDKEVKPDKVSRDRNEKKCACIVHCECATFINKTSLGCLITRPLSIISLLMATE